jgi:hypothetical protein
VLESFFSHWLNGEGGIRTHGPLRVAGFQDRQVTAQKYCGDCRYLRSAKNVDRMWPA